MSNFSNPFKKQPTAKEAAKGVKREVRSSQRDLDRELRDIDRREAQLLADIKKQARDGRGRPCSLARNLVQLQFAGAAPEGARHRRKRLHKPVRWPRR